MRNGNTPRTFWLHFLRYCFVLSVWDEALMESCWLPSCRLLQPDSAARTFTIFWRKQLVGLLKGSAIRICTCEHFRCVAAKQCSPEWPSAVSLSFNIKASYPHLTLNWFDFSAYKYLVNGLILIQSFSTLPEYLKRSIQSICNILLF